MGNIKLPIIQGGGGSSSIDPSMFGCTKIAVDRINLRSNMKQLQINHSLGEIPLVSILKHDEFTSFSTQIPQQSGYLPMDFLVALLISGMFHPLDPQTSYTSQNPYWYISDNQNSSTYTITAVNNTSASSAGVIYSASQVEYRLGTSFATYGNYTLITMA